MSFRFNKDIAKAIGAHNYHKVIKSEPGTVFLRLSDLTRYVWTGGNTYQPRGSFYLTPSSDTNKRLAELERLREELAELTAQADKLKEFISEKERLMYKALTSSFSETSVIFIYREKQDERIEDAKFWKKALRKEDSLLVCGIRKRSDNEWLYVALVKHKGPIDDEVRAHYEKALFFRSEFPWFGYSPNRIRIERAKNTAYRMDKIEEYLVVLMPADIKKRCEEKLAEKHAAEKKAEAEREVARQEAMKAATARLETNPPTCKIFAYEGYVGAQINMNGKFLNNPDSPHELGCVIHTRDVAITPTAVNIIKRARRESGSFAELMLTRHSDGSSSIGLLGRGKVMLGRDFHIGRECDTSVLQDCTVCEFAIPDDFVAYIIEKNQ